MGIKNYYYNFFPSAGTLHVLKTCGYSLNLTHEFFYQEGEIFRLTQLHTQTLRYSSCRHQQRRVTQAKMSKHKPGSKCVELTS